LFDVLGIGEDFTVHGGQLVGAGSENFCNGEQALLWCCQLLVAPVVLSEAKY
jgi:hypothetical protein